MPTSLRLIRRIVILVVVYLLVGCVTDQIDLYFSKDTECSAPCWHDISPGETTEAEAESILRSLSFVSQLDFKTSSNQGVTVARWQFTPSMTYGYATFKNAVLQHLTVRPSGLHLGEVIDRLGIPDHIVAGYEPVEEVVYDIELYYPTKGIAVTVSDSPMGALSDAQRMTRDLKVTDIQYFAPTDLKTFLTEIDGRSESNAQNILDRLQAWPGYGPNVVRMGK